jgi:hypothetical protein
MPALRDSREVSLQHVTVLSSHEADGVTKEIVIQRSEITVPPGQTLVLHVARVGRSLRRFDDQAELALLDGNGTLLGARTESLRGEAAAALTLEAAATERKVVAAAKIVRQSGQDETSFYDSVTQAPRLRAWVTLGILVDESKAAGENPAAHPSSAQGDDEASPLFAAALSR